MEYYTSIEKALNLLGINIIRNIQRAEKQNSFWHRPYGSWKSLNQFCFKEYLINAIVAPQTQREYLLEFGNSKDIKELVESKLTLIETVEILKKYKIRFPYKKSEWILNLNFDCDFKNMFEPSFNKNLEAERQLRDNLLQIFKANGIKGFGLKTISLFLKMCGVNKFIAVIDSHIVKFAKICGLIPGELKLNLANKQKYEFLEGWLNEIYSILDISYKISSQLNKPYTINHIDDLIYCYNKNHLL